MTLAISQALTIPLWALPLILLCVVGIWEFWKADDDTNWWEAERRHSTLGLLGWLGAILLVVGGLLL